MKIRVEELEVKHIYTKPYTRQTKRIEAFLENCVKMRVYPNSFEFKRRYCFKSR